MRAHIRELELEAALAIMTAHLTDAQITLISQHLSGKRADVLEAELMSCAAPEAQRAGILLPYLVAGPLTDYQLRVKGPVCLVLGAFCATGGKGTAAAELINSCADAAIGNARNVAVGSEAFYNDTAGFQNPTALHRASSNVSAAQLFAAQGLHPSDLGTGYVGLSSVKGNRPNSTAAMGKMGGTPRAIATDPSLASAAALAASLAEDVK